MLYMIVLLLLLFLTFDYLSFCSGLNTSDITMLLLLLIAEDKVDPGRLRRRKH